MFDLNLFDLVFYGFILSFALGFLYNIYRLGSLIRRWHKLRSEGFPVAFPSIVIAEVQKTPIELYYRTQSELKNRGHDFEISEVWATHQQYVDEMQIDSPEILADLVIREFENASPKALS